MLLTAYRHSHSLVPGWDGGYIFMLPQHKFDLTSMHSLFTTHPWYFLSSSTMSYVFPCLSTLQIFFVPDPSSGIWAFAAVAGFAWRLAASNFVCWDILAKNGKQLTLIVRKLIYRKEILHEQCKRWIKWWYYWKATLTIITISVAYNPEWIFASCSTFPCLTNSVLWISLHHSGRFWFFPLLE